MRSRFKNKLSVFIYAIVFVFLSTISFSNIHADTGVPKTISYQGRLTDSGGNSLGGAGTVYYFKFSIWDNPTVGSGTKLWPASTPGSTMLNVRQGSFSVDIGDTTNGYPDVLDYNFNTNQKVYIQIEVSGDNSTFETLTPRSPISAAAFSQVASSVNGTNDSSFGTSTPFLNTLISALSTNVNKAVMTIKGAVGQVANLFNITDSSNNSLFTVTAGGNVGVGTSTPGSLLTVAGNGSFGSISTSGGIAAGAQITTGSLYMGGGAGNELKTYLNTVVKISNEGVSAGSDAVYLQASYNTPQLRVTTNGIKIDNALVVGSTTMPTNGVAWFNGNVGVGTNSPTNILDISSSTNATLRLNSGDYNPTIQLAANGNNSASIKYVESVGFLRLGVTRGAGNIAFDSNGVEMMRIAGTGNVGIGTTVPATKLSISSSTANILFDSVGSGYGGIGFNSTLTNANAALFGNGSDTILNVASGGGVYLKIANDAAGNGQLAMTSGKLVYTSGNVGIGTTTPSAKLAITGTAGTGDIFRIASSTNANILTVTAGGNLGIGTSGPIYPLDVVGTMRIQDAYGYGLLVDNTGTGGSKALSLTSTGGTTRVRFDSGSDTANNYIMGNLGVGTTTPSAKLAITGNPGNGDIFRIASSTNANIFTVTSNGNVGIGTSTPDTLLTLAGTGSTGNYLNIVNNNGNPVNNLVFSQNIASSGQSNSILWRSTVGSVFDYAKITSSYGSSFANSYMNFAVANSAGTLQDRLRIDVNGNVGIGTTTPTEALSIAGNINLTGALKINGNIGSNGQILQTTGSGVQWVATSSLGISQDLNVLTNIIFGNGNATTTIGANSVAIGYKNSPTVLNSVLIGNQNFSGNATSSVALGILNNSGGATVNTTTGAITGTIIATSTIGLLSTSVGVLNMSRGAQSTTLGYGNTTYDLYSTAVGYMNSVNSGSGDRSSAFGTSNTVTGLDGATAIGYSNTVSNSGALGFGRANSIAGNNAMGFGFSNNITGGAASAYSGSYGYSNTITSAAGSYIFGTGNTVTANSAYAIGGSITNATAASLMIGPSNTAKLTILTSGNTGVGTTTPLDKLQVFGDIRMGTTSTNGCLKDYSGTGIIGTCSSDERLKTNIVDLSDDYLDKMAKLRVITYNWNDTARDINKVDTTVTNYGLLAQNVEQNFPELVTTDSNGYKQVNYSRIPLYLLKSLQELTKKVMSFSDEFRTKKLCVGDTCIDENQLKQLLQNQNVQHVQTNPTVVEPDPVVETPTNQETVQSEPATQPEVVVEPTPTPEPAPIVETPPTPPTETPTL